MGVARDVWDEYAKRGCVETVLIAVYMRWAAAVMRWDTFHAYGQFSEPKK